MSTESVKNLVPPETVPYPSKESEPFLLEGRIVSREEWEAHLASLEDEAKIPASPEDYEDACEEARNLADRVSRLETQIQALNIILQTLSPKPITNPILTVIRKARKAGLITDEFIQDLLNQAKFPHPKEATEADWGKLAILLAPALWEMVEKAWELKITEKS